jgi:hypothetical protein
MRRRCTERDILTGCPRVGWEQHPIEGPRDRFLRLDFLTVFAFLTAFAAFALSGFFAIFMLTTLYVAGQGFETSPRNQDPAYRAA